ncbi:M15 family metallopeptidase [Azospirillum argentinense]|uniref:Peptidase M15B domain-containing protein n=1 Tax=Azospirillum argentinense TaxID=2970906 RepID=A0A5B0KSK2_9PROT|nr:M15 family metallopeptidase [Azospirillum argentinense]KAA1054458.1 hypothetical protein FH063_006714 [Azospirillum argentinense]
MRTPLLPVTMPSIYKKNGIAVPLPKRMALCSPDTQRALYAIRQELLAQQGDLVLSDLFRSYDMQLQSHKDYVSGQKKAFSPAPGGSLHEAGRAFDLDLGAIRISLSELWQIGKRHGAYPVIAQPDPKQSEAWHFDVRGSHNVVYEYYKRGEASNMKPYTAMAVSAILATDIRVDVFENRQGEAFLQSGLVRLGHTLGAIDGRIGMKTQAALADAGIALTSLDAMIQAVENQLQARFPDEYTSPDLLIADTGQPSTSDAIAAL